LLHADARNTFNRWNVFAFKAREHGEGGAGIDSSKTQAEEADLQRQGGWWPLEPEMKRGKERRRRKRRRRRREKDSRVARTDLIGS
jgi:hypothetical protein